MQCPLCWGALIMEICLELGNLGTTRRHPTEVEKRRIVELIDQIGSLQIVWSQLAGGFPCRFRGDFPHVFSSSLHGIQDLILRPTVVGLEPIR